MKGDSSTAPTLPPPGPSRPGSRVLGPGASPQQAEESEVTPLDSSKVMISRPSFWKAAEARICGTHCSRKLLIDCRPPGSPLAQGESWPSWHRLGVMKV